MQIKNRVLILIDIQHGFSDVAHWGPRNNPKFEESVRRSLEIARQISLQIIHVQHLSTETNSPLRPERLGSAFSEFAQPQKDELIVQKRVHSAFIGTNLEQTLRNRKISTVFLAGLTSDHCVSTTARMASDLGFKVVLIADAMACHDRKALNGEIIKAEQIHQASLASLKDEFADVIESHFLEKTINT